jgi:hypothetical protein
LGSHIFPRCGRGPLAIFLGRVISTLILPNRVLTRATPYATREEDPFNSAYCNFARKSPKGLHLQIPFAARREIPLYQVVKFTSRHPTHLSEYAIRTEEHQFPQAQLDPYRWPENHHLLCDYCLGRPRTPEEKVQKIGRIRKPDGQATGIVYLPRGSVKAAQAVVDADSKGQLRQTEPSAEQPNSASAPKEKKKKKPMDLGIAKVIVANCIYSQLNEEFGNHG